ncbi:hypothetical protein [Nostoc sp. ChiVER01]|uniref:hypothetical protein n=1 Tax=Nostoc sp. ChiVER01 TaxID=3075382 RepID=UPI002AD37F47|nr:hypothetical protein [Nostoc sp. ChiVER01]MDZ8222129.1 hypothetical protein [Nostoc sp. ChiVER01]
MHSAGDRFNISGTVTPSDIVHKLNKIAVSGYFCEEFSLFSPFCHNGQTNSRCDRYIRNI